MKSHRLVLRLLHLLDWFLLQPQIQKQGCNHYAVTTFPQKPFDSNPVHRLADDRRLRVTAPSSLAMSYPTDNSFISSAGPNLVGSASHQPVPNSTRLFPVKNSISPIVGTTELRHMSKNSDAPAQLTIFYAGSVCVYDDISPEKAQAIMLLAGNKPTITSYPQVSVLISPVQMPTYVQKAHVFKDTESYYHEDNDDDYRDAAVHIYNYTVIDQVKGIHGMFVGLVLLFLHTCPEKKQHMKNQLPLMHLST